MTFSNWSKASLEHVRVDGVYEQLPKCRSTPQSLQPQNTHCIRFGIIIESWLQLLYCIMKVMQENKLFSNRGLESSPETGFPPTSVPVVNNSLILRRYWRKTSTSPWLRSAGFGRTCCVDWVDDIPSDSLGASSSSPCVSAGRVSCSVWVVDISTCNGDGFCKNRQNCFVLVHDLLRGRIV